MNNENIAEQYDYQMGLSDKELKQMCNEIRADERKRIKAELEKIGDFDLLHDNSTEQHFIIEKSDWDKFWRDKK